jgi:hypothetical protein
VARHRKKEKFTALFHHITVQLLREAFFELKENAAPGVDGLRWGEYEADLEHRLEDLHARLQRGAYRALPGRRGYIPKSDGRLRPLAVAALVGSLKKLPPHRLYAAIGPGTALTPKPVPPSRSEEREWAAGDDPAQKKRKESGRQPLEVDGGRRQVGLNLHVGEAASHGAREPMPGLGFAMEAL